jgi:hypothetical protein
VLNAHRLGANCSSETASRTRLRTRSKTSGRCTQSGQKTTTSRSANNIGRTASTVRTDRAQRHITCLIDFGPKRVPGRVPHLEFNIGAHPGDSNFWVDAKDELSLSPQPRPQTDPMTRCVERIFSANARLKSCTKCVRSCSRLCQRSDQPPRGHHLPAGRGAPADLSAQWHDARGAEGGLRQRLPRAVPGSLTRLAVP